jgi:ferredoxin
MSNAKSQSHQQLLIERDHFRELIAALAAKGYRVVGPVVRDGAIIYDDLKSVDDLPIGWTDEQDGGMYRIKKRGDKALFGYAVGPHSWKKFLHPPVVKLWRAKRSGNDFQAVAEDQPREKFAFIGVRSCELHAIAVQDKVLLEGQHVDPIYENRRRDLFIVALNCGQAGGACFCVSMNTGPKATFGFDLALTEIVAADRHYFVAEAGTERGAEILREITHREAREEEVKTAERVVENTAAQMGRYLDTSDIKDLLYRNYEHPRWEEVAQRCLTCANCTMVCPTCFCTTVEDTTDLTGDNAERWRKWDSCFNLDFSYIHGGSVRSSVQSRYRQWMTHKLATWIDQFGTSGCVGCGRCITWCPVGIDITEEARAIRDSDADKGV